MKHDDFLKVLKSLKSQYTRKHSSKYKYIKPKEEADLSTCICKDSDGKSKYLYTSQKELEYMLSSKSVKLTSYPCPYEKGWHVTKN